MLSINNVFHSSQHNRRHHHHHHHHQLSSAAESTSSTSLPSVADADYQFAESSSPSSRRRAYGQRHAMRHKTSDGCTGICWSCWLRQRVIVSILSAGLTAGIIIVIASLVVYSQSK
jgi:hypothetical protein